MKQIILVLCVSLSVCVLGDEDLMTNGNKVVDNGDVAMLCDWRVKHLSVTNNTMQKLLFDHEKIRNLALAGRVISANAATEVCKVMKTNKGKGKAGVVAMLAALVATLLVLLIMLFEDYPLVAIVGGIVIIVVIVLSAIFVRKKRKAAGSSNQQRVE